ncbi:unnamed protein product [marine sediment metagenome]|uniref:Uncharacterized protein n=1 Tax=marine sediment metagenome TaxID=412755 RepID=X1JWC4_9ZZZZ
MYHDGHQQQKGRNHWKVRKIVLWDEKEEKAISKEGYDQGNKQQCNYELSLGFKHGLFIPDKVLYGIIH